MCKTCHEVLNLGECVVFGPENLQEALYIKAGREAYGEEKSGWSTRGLGEWKRGR